MATITSDATSQVSEPKKHKRGRIERDQIKWGLFFISPWIIGIIVFYLIPFVASFGFSLFRFNLANPDATEFIGLENWQRALFEDPNTYQSFGVTFLFAFISLPIGLGFAILLALLMNTKAVRGKALFRTMFFMPTMIPLVAAVLIWTGVLNEQTGWFNLLLENIFGIQATGPSGIRWLANPNLIYLTLTFIGLWAVGNTMMITLAGLQSIPTEMYEAAEIDGAGWTRQLISITIPMLSPVLFYNLVLGTIGLMQYFLVPFVLNGGSGFPDGRTNFVGIYFFNQAFRFFNMGYGAVIAWLIFIVSLVLTIVLFGSARYWVYYAGEE
ncbi:MAG: sugar ABC transporter permease [Anaerolineae bacterium]|nr:sugar ABC transporter permease [Anaerolineae bacterium]